MLAPDFTKPNPEFDRWVATMPRTHWAKYDLSACRLGWEAARALSFESLTALYLQWVSQTFQGETVVDQLAHLREEFDELIRSPREPEEYADVLMLLLCVAHGSGVDILQAFREKFELNKSRRWEKTERGFRHVQKPISAAEV